MELTIEYPPQVVRLCTVAVVTAVTASLFSSNVIGAMIGICAAVA